MHDAQSIGTSSSNMLVHMSEGAPKMDVTASDVLSSDSDCAVVLDILNFLYGWFSVWISSNVANLELGLLQGGHQWHFQEKSVTIKYKLPLNKSHGVRGKLSCLRFG